MSVMKLKDHPAFKVDLEEVAGLFTTSLLSGLHWDLEIIKKGFKDEVDRTRSTYEKVNLPPPEYNESSIEKEWIPQITDWDDITLIERLTQFENITGLPGNQYVLI